MASSDEHVELANLRGNVDVPIVSFPAVRGTVRRSDPDGGHASPYFPGLAGTALQVYTGVVGGGPTLTTINFATNNYADAVAAVNAAAPALIKWLESDGFACIQSVNQGGKYFLAIAGGTAAPILGFTIFPAPESVSVAGEIASAPGDRNQHNPQYTMLLAHGENITTQVINRAVLGLMQEARQKLNDLDKEIVVYKLFQCTQFNSVNPLNPSNTLRVANGTADKISVKALIGLGLSGLDEVVTVLDNINKKAIIQGNTYVKATSVTYGPSDQGAPHGSSITWGTPGVGGTNGVFIGQGGVAASLKTALTNITSILGSQVKAPGSLFVTNKVLPGDHLKIASATNDLPFNHDGEYAVVVVVDEDTLTVRPLGFNEDKVDQNNDTPSWLNPHLGIGENYGQIAVYVSNGMRATGPSGASADAIFIQTNGSFTTGQQAYVRLPVTTTLRKMLVGDQLAHPRWDSDLALLDGSNFFIKQNTFNAGIKIRAVPQVGGVISPRVKADVDDGSSDFLYMLLAESVNPNDVPVRIYMKQTSTDLFITVNAQYDGVSGSWVQDDGAQQSTRYDFSDGSFTIKSMQAGVGAGVVVNDNWPSTLISLNSYDTRDVGAGGNASLRTNARLSSLIGGNPTGDRFVLMFQFTGADVSGFTGFLNTAGDNIISRIYADTKTSGLIYTVNASWDGTNWNPDVNLGGPTSQALKISFDRGIRMQAQFSNTPWLDTAWDNQREVRFDFIDLSQGLDNAAGQYRPMRIFGDLGLQAAPPFSDTADVHPIMVAADSVPFVRHKIDNLGYAMDSNAGMFNWNWSKDVGAAQTASPIIAFPEWLFSRTGTGGTYTWAPPNGSGDAFDSNGYFTRSPFLQANLSNVNGEDEFIISPVICAPYAGSMAIEWDMTMVDPVTGGKYDYFIGLTSEATGFHTLGGSNAYAYFKVPSVDPTNLYVVSTNPGGPSTGTVNQMVAQFNRWGRYRIEIHPGNDNKYGHPVVRFWRDGNPAGTLTNTGGFGTIVPNGSTFRFAFGAKCVAPGAPASKRISVGSVRVVWNNWDYPVGATANNP